MSLNTSGIMGHKSAILDLRLFFKKCANIVHQSIFHKIIPIIISDLSIKET